MKLLPPTRLCAAALFGTFLSLGLTACPGTTPDDSGTPDDDGGQPGDDGGTPTDEALCTGSGGTWDPGSCGPYDCGEFPACDALIPGCDCGPTSNFVAGEGCVVDAACDAPTDGGTSSDEELCTDSGGTWDEASCGHYECGQQPACQALIPGCDCGASSNFVDGEGCVVDAACDAATDGGTPTDEVLCTSTGGTWDLAACGHYDCGLPQECAAVIPGCDCGATSNFVDGEGCVVDEACASCATTCAGWDTTDDGCVDFCLDSPAPACAGLAGLPCAVGATCEDDPSDGCDPQGGGADCIGVCVPQYCPAVACDAVDTDLDGCLDRCVDPMAAACGGIAGLLCPEVTDACVDDPADGCDPQNGGADCLGICIPAPDCPIAIDCAPGYTAVDSDGDGCEDVCVTISDPVYLE